MDTATIKCKSCGRVLDERTDAIASNPCPHCGGRERDVLIELMDQVPPVHDRLDGKIRAATGGKPFYEFQDGDDLQVSTGKWLTKERIIDRQNDRYREIITDPETGNVIHHCDEPLSQHQGHGSAKQKRREET